MLAACRSEPEEHQASVSCAEYRGMPHRGPLPSRCTAQHRSPAARQLRRRLRSSWFVCRTPAQHGATVEPRPVAAGNKPQPDGPPRRAVGSADTPQSGRRKARYGCGL
eukprot:361241-Chlamydomonas_euryale.AAC.5